jgi:hypothetical protein
MNNLSNWASCAIVGLVYDIEENIHHCKRYNGVDIATYKHIIWDIKKYCNDIQINCLALKQMIDEVNNE